MILGTDLLGRRLPSLVEGLACDRLFVLIDPALRQLQAERITVLQAELPPSTAYYSLEYSGEESKGTSQLAELWSWLAEAGASRQSLRRRPAGPRRLRCRHLHAGHTDDQCPHDAAVHGRRLRGG